MIFDEFDEAQSRTKFLGTEVERLPIKIENDDDKLRLKLCQAQV